MEKPDGSRPGPKRISHRVGKRVEPSMSVKRKVTVPVGRPGIGGLRSDARAKPAEGTFGDRRPGSSGSVPRRMNRPNSPPLWVKTAVQPIRCRPRIPAP